MKKDGIPNLLSKDEIEKCIQELPIIREKPEHCQHKKGCVYELFSNSCRSFSLGFLFNVMWALIKYLRSQKKGDFVEHLSQLKDVKLPFFLSSFTFLLRLFNCGLKNCGIQNQKLISAISGCN